MEPDQTLPPTPPYLDWSRLTYMEPSGSLTGGSGASQWPTLRPTRSGQTLIIRALQKTLAGADPLALRVWWLRSLHDDLTLVCKWFGPEAALDCLWHMTWEIKSYCPGASEWARSYQSLAIALDPTLTDIGD